MGLIFAEQNTLFFGALALMLIIAVFEGVAMLLGAGLSDVVDNLLPDVQVDVPDVELQGSSGVLSSVLGWLFIGRIPALIWLVLFLTTFSIGGYGLQAVTHSVSDGYLPSTLAVPPALIIAVIAMRLIGHVFGRFRLQDETEAVSSASFVGAMATITIGESRRGLAAEAKLTDRFGTTHYIRVEPENDDDRFGAGEQVLLVQQLGSKFTAVRPTNPNLKSKN